MAEPTQTAVIVPVEAADAVVAKHRRHLDVAASWGVAAHVTVVYPFVPPTSLNESVISRLTAVFAVARPFECMFKKCCWFGEEVLWLAPDPDLEFRDLTAAVVKEFPQYPPYGRVFDGVVPHLTIGESRRGTASQLRAAEEDVTGKLPISSEIARAMLIAGTDRPNSWHTVATLPLGTH
jgi:2'-5' RNA ligase